MQLQAEEDKADEELAAELVLESGAPLSSSEMRRLSIERRQLKSETAARRKSVEQLIDSEAAQLANAAQGSADHREGHQR